MVNLNSYSSRQKLNKSVDEITSLLKLSQSYAKTRQFPVGYAGTDLQYIRVQLVDGKYLEADANGIGTTYFSTLVTNSEVSIGTTPAILYFWSGTGRLVGDTSGTPYGASELATIYIHMKGETNTFSKLEINSLGQIKFVGTFNE